MGDAFDPQEAAAVPNKVVGTKLGITWTPDDCLSSVTLNVVYYDDDVELGRRQVNISDGVMLSHSVSYTVEEKAADPSLVDDDPDADWTLLKNVVNNGTATAAAICTVLATRKWGRKVLRKAWRS